MKFNANYNVVECVLLCIVVTVIIVKVYKKNNVSELFGVPGTTGKGEPRVTLTNQGTGRNPVMITPDNEGRVFPVNAPGTNPVRVDLFAQPSGTTTDASLETTPSTTSSPSVTTRAVTTPSVFTSTPALVTTRPVTTQAVTTLAATTPSRTTPYVTTSSLTTPSSLSVISETFKSHSVFS